MNGFRRVVLFFLLYASTSVFAASVSESEARRIALQFQHERMASKVVGSILIRSVVLNTSGVPLRMATNPAYYVFNVGENQGFVIVSGETGTTSILGYSDEGQIRATHLPENMNAWLANYERAIEALRSGAIKTDETATDRTTRESSPTPIVPPLLGYNKWTQLHPFNLNCPWDAFFRTRSSVGCVALAMGQIMHFHHWPSKPKGQLNYYVDNLGLQSVNLDSITYDWSRMWLPIDPEIPTIQDTLVASLLHHCGASVSMQYSAAGSSADVTSVGPAMVKYFDYDSDIQHYKREYYTDDVWESMLRLELDEARPVLYAAFNKNVGHVFVCDGYDSNNLFHINWGWGGNGNGYFELSSLNPDSPDALGVSDGFSKDQSMLVRIQQPDQTNRVTYSLGMLGGNVKGQATVFNRSNTYSVRFDCKNSGTNTFVGYLALGYYDSFNQLKLLEKTSTNIESIQSGRSKTYNPSGLTLPSDLREGLYRIFAVYRPSDSIRWNIVPGTNGIQLQIGGDFAKFIYGNSFASLELKSPINILQQVYQNQTSEVYITFMNYDIAFNSTLILDLYSLPDAKFVKTIYKGNHQLQAGTIQTLKLKAQMSCPPGNYFLVVRSSSPYVQNFVTRLEPYTCNNLNLDVKPAPGPPDLQLDDTMSLKRSLSKHRLDSMTFTAKLTNHGGFTNTTIVGLIHPMGEETCHDTLPPTEILIDSLETKTLTFKVNLSLRDGLYQMTLCQLRDGLYVPIRPYERSNITFAIGNPNARADSLNVYWHLEEDRLVIDGGFPVKCITLYDLSGIQQKYVENQAEIPVGDLPKGVYPIKVEMNGKILFDKYFRR